MRIQVGQIIRATAVEPILGGEPAKFVITIESIDRDGITGPYTARGASYCRGHFSWSLYDFEEYKYPTDSEINNAITEAIGLLPVTSACREVLSFFLKLRKWLGIE